MKTGDLVRYNDRFWIVFQHDPKRSGLSFLLSPGGEQLQVPHDFDLGGTLTVIANPSESWPVLTVPEKPMYGLLQEMRLPGATEALTLFEDWVPSDPFRPGGPVFFNPKLRLRYGDSILVTFKKKVLRVDVPSTFGTVKQKIKANTKAPVVEATAFSRLLEKDD